MADLYGTTVAANARKVTTGVTLQGASLEFFEIDFGVDVRQADGAGEVTWLVYTLISELGFTPVVIGNIQADAGSNAGQLLRFAVEVPGGAEESVSNAAQGYVRTNAVAEPVVNYRDASQGTGVYTAVLSTALTDIFDNYAAFAYTDDAGAAQTINLTSAAVTLMNF